MGGTWTRITGSTLVNKIPCQVGAVIVTPSGDSKKANLTLYDGESASDPKVIQIYGATGISIQILFPDPLVLTRGLYCVAGGNFGEALIQNDVLKS